VLYRDPVLPTARFLSSPGYSAAADQVAEIVARLSELMLVDPGSFMLEIYDGSATKEKITPSGKKRAVGHFRMAAGRLVISLDQRETSDRMQLAAIAVHELCHLRLLGEGRISGERPDGERLTDLLTVYFGFGIFTTNAAMSFARAERGFTIMPSGLFDDLTLNAARRNDVYHRLGYLNSAEFGYALACYSWARGETELPGWARHVNPGPRVQMERGLAYLARTTRRPPRNATNLAACAGLGPCPRLAVHPAGGRPLATRAPTMRTTPCLPAAGGSRIGPRPSVRGGKRAQSVRPRPKRIRRIRVPTEVVFY
jgi:hypothetical protein